MAVVARTSSQCQSVAEEIGGDALAISADVSDTGALLVEAAWRHEGVLSDAFLTPELLDLRDRTRAFVAGEVIPAEGADGAGLDPELLARLGAAARRSGLFAPSAPPELGGLGLDLRACSVVFEEAGYSLPGRTRSTAPPGRGQHAPARAIGPTTSGAATSRRSPRGRRAPASR